MEKLSAGNLLARARLAMALQALSTGPGLGTGAVGDWGAWGAWGEAWPWGVAGMD